MGSRENLVQILNDLFAKKGCTQEELAAYVGQSRQAVGKWLAGDSFPRAKSLDNLAEFFGVTVADLVGYEDQESKLLRLFRTMNTDGKAKLMERAEELVLLHGENHRIVPFRRRHNA